MAAQKPAEENTHVAYVKDGTKGTADHSCHSDLGNHMRNYAFAEGVAANCQAPEEAGQNVAPDSSLSLHHMPFAPRKNRHREAGPEVEAVV